jgi:hypothetical protein
MITIWPVEKTNFRAFGWVQDPSNLRSLCNVTAIFDENSRMHKSLIDDIIPTLVEERDGRDELIAVLGRRPLRIEYTKLVGTAFKPRNDSRCNGIVQAAVKGQRRPFIGDWQADNFVRWAYAFHFIRYNYEDDTFEITEEGRVLVDEREDSEELSQRETEELTKAILSYPPAVRILRLLASEDAHLTKFELGKQLGFIGEGGFTSLPQGIFLRTLATMDSQEEINKMKADWEGSSDKYARMIAKWLTKLGLVAQVAKTFHVSIKDEERKVDIGQAYQITAKGYVALNRTVGKSSSRRLAKNICFEMLATKATDREYLRTRRAFLIKYLVEAKQGITTPKLQELLTTQSLEVSTGVIEDDLMGLTNIGLNIERKGDRYYFQDELNDFTIPVAKLSGKSELENEKEELRLRLTHLSHEYLSLLDLAYDSNQNRLFEMKTMELFTEECGFEGLHLGGSRKPDGILYTTKGDRRYGIIVDTKAYSGGYSLPISQADEMERYIGENQLRDSQVNPNEWWKLFDPDVDTFYYMFVAGHFKGSYQSQIDRVNRNRNTKGIALSVREMLDLVNRYKSGELNHAKLEELLFQDVK